MKKQIKINFIMKIFIIITLKLFLLNSVLFAQCYQENIDEGIKHFNSGNYTKAKEFFEDALKCRFNYIGDNEAAGEWISKCNEKIYGVYVGSVTLQM